MLGRDYLMIGISTPHNIWFIIYNYIAFIDLAPLFCYLQNNVNVYTPFVPL